VFANTLHLALSLIHPLGFPDRAIMMMISGFGVDGGCGDGRGDGGGGFETHPYVRDARHALGWPGGNRKPIAERELTGMT